MVERDAFGRPRDPGSATERSATSRPAPPTPAPPGAEPSAATPPSATPRPTTPRTRRRSARSLIVTTLLSVVAVAGTMTFAVGWANDLPRTRAFALAHAPFAHAPWDDARSLLRVDVARAVLDRALTRIPPGDRETAVIVSAERLSLFSGDAAGTRTWVMIRGDGRVVEDRTPRAETGRGVPVAHIRALDLAAPLRAARQRWTAIGGSPKPPSLRLDAPDGRLRGWSIMFASDVPAEQRSTFVDMAGRVIR